MSSAAHPGPLRGHVLTACQDGGSQVRAATQPDQVRVVSAAGGVTEGWTGLLSEQGGHTAEHRLDWRPGGGWWDNFRGGGGCEAVTQGWTGGSRAPDTRPGKQSPSCPERDAPG